MIHKEVLPILHTFCVLCIMCIINYLFCLSCTMSIRCIFGSRSCSAGMGLRPLLPLCRRVYGLYCRRVYGMSSVWISGRRWWTQEHRARSTERGAWSTDRGARSTEHNSECSGICDNVNLLTHLLYLISVAILAQAPKDQSSSVPLDFFTQL